MKVFPVINLSAFPGCSIRFTENEFITSCHTGNQYPRNLDFSSKIITIYNTVILVRSVIRFLNRHFLFIEKVQAFLDLILSRAL